MGEFDEVIGMRKTFIKERLAKAGKEKVDVDDTTLFLAKFKNGAMGSFEAKRVAAGHRKDKELRLMGTKGASSLNLGE